MDKKTKKLAGVAFGSMLLAATAVGTAHAEHHEGGGAKSGECHGINACKGQGACGGKGHGCAGKNECKGQGWLKMTKAECDEKGGTFKE